MDGMMRPMAVGYKPIGDNGSRRRKSVLAMLIVFTTLTLLVSSSSFNRVAAEEATVTTTTETLFELYKATLAVATGSSAGVLEFVNSTITHVDPNFDLGCGGVKVNAYLLPYGPQLHWVESDILSNDDKPIERWQPYFERLNGDMSKFNAFMHNKISLFTTDLTKPLAQLERAGIKTLRRRGTRYTGLASPTGEVGHLVFQIAGRAYELVGPVTADFHVTAKSWDEWTVDECPAAHRLNDDLDEYVSKYKDFVAVAKDVDVMYAWAQDRGYYPPMLAGISLALSPDDTVAIDDLFSDLDSLAEMDSYVESDAYGCTVYRLNLTVVYDWKAPLRYVVNERSLDDLLGNETWTVAEYNGYIANTHRRQKSDDWSGWDHWLDQHLGLKYVGDDAYGMAAALNGKLSAENRVVGQRTTDDFNSQYAVHWYTGYPGPSTWEYWVEGVEDYSVNDLADICACVPSNNDRLFFDSEGANCSDYGLGDYLL